MAKFTNYVLLMSGLMILFHFGGLLNQCNNGLCTNETPNSLLLSLLLNPETLQDSPIALRAIIVLEGIIASAIVIGFALAGNLELGLMSAFSIYLFNLLWDFMYVFRVVYDTNPVLAIIFFAPALLLYVITLLEWWRGVST